MEVLCAAMWQYLLILMDDFVGTPVELVDVLRGAEVYDDCPVCVWLML